ncbi:TetR/AcrR family transcriptional regulator [Nocardiopsis alkaliphila]|uniref:TetR/AcrR family transcriptional regulator n=1 Tax=Nocardiopsis alkaliphila TaxID=225762 RepID=UPI000688B43A|nr:TetR family transcriptional regulator C-terminal domain-containing protein [Nocardiopsis alkaliphila]
MPKVVNKLGRRRLIAEALHRIAARDGLEGVSVRSVAAEATVSAGAVQREFGTKDKLLRFALQVSVEEVVGQFGRIRVGPGRMAFTDALHQVLVDLLPTDERRLARARIWTAFYARAAVDAAFSDTIAELNVRTRSSLIALLDYARRQGELAPEVDVEKVSELLLVLIDGLWMAGARLPEEAELDGPMAAIESLLTLLRASPAPKESGAGASVRR